MERGSILGCRLQKRQQIFARNQYAAHARYTKTLQVALSHIGANRGRGHVQVGSCLIDCQEIAYRIVDEGGRCSAGSATIIGMVVKSSGIHGRSSIQDGEAIFHSDFKIFRIENMSRDVYKPGRSVFLLIGWL